MLSSRTNVGITKNLKMLNEVNAVSFLAQLGQSQTCLNVLGQFALLAERVFMGNKHGRGHGPEFHPISCFILVTSFFVLCFCLLCCLKCPHSVLSGSLDFFYHQLLKVMLSTCNVVLSLTVTTAFG